MKLASKINRTQERLRNVGLKSDEFQRHSRLAEALDLALHNKNDEALEKLNKIIEDSNETSFVQARALALTVYVTIQKDNRQCRDTKSLIELIERALQKDTRVAFAYNAMGLCKQTKAMRDQSGKDWGSYSLNMQESINYYMTGFEVRPTAQAKFRFVNNKIWAHCEMFYASRKSGYPEKEFLKATGYADTSAFFEGAGTELHLAGSLSPNNPAWRETRAELLSLKSTYEGEDLWHDAKQLYLDAIDHGLLVSFQLVLRLWITS